MLVLSKLGEEHSRWIPLSPAFPGVEIEIRHATPDDLERFRQNLIATGVCKKTEGLQWNPGRFPAFCQAMAEKFVTNWRGPIRLTESDEATAPYTSEQMGLVLQSLSSAITAISEAISEEAAFFCTNGSGPQT